MLTKRIAASGDGNKKNSNLVPRVVATLVQRNGKTTTFPVPLDKGNEDSGDEIDSIVTTTSKRSGHKNIDKFLLQNKKISPKTWILLALVKENCGLNNTSFFKYIGSLSMKYACVYHETYIKLLLGIDALPLIVKFLLCFLSVYFCFHNFRLVNALIKTFLKSDN